MFDADVAGRIAATAATNSVYLAGSAADVEAGALRVVRNFAAMSEWGFCCY